MLLGACKHWKQWGQHPAKCLSQRWAGSTCLAWSGLSGMREMIWSRDPCSSTSLHGAFSSTKHSLETDVAWDGCYISLEASSESGNSHCKVQSKVDMSDVSFVSGRTLRESSPAWDHPGVQINPMDNGCLATVRRPKPVQLSARFIESESTCLAVNGCDLEFGMPKAKYILPWSTMGLQFCWHYCSVQAGSHWRNRRFNKAGCVQINAGLPRPSGPSLQDILAFGLRKPMVDSRCSSCKLGWMTKAWSEFLWGTKGALNHWGSAWEKCKKLIDSHCSNLFSSIYQICPAGLWDEMNLLAVSPETLHLQASRACYTERLHHQVLGLEARVMQINQIRCKKLNWEQAMVNQMAIIATQCRLTHPLQQPHTLRVHLWEPCRKNWWAIS